MIGVKMDLMMVSIASIVWQKTHVTFPTLYESLVLLFTVMKEAQLYLYYYLTLPKFRKYLIFDWGERVPNYCILVLFQEKCLNVELLLLS